MKELKYLLRALALVICVLCGMWHGGKAEAAGEVEYVELDRYENSTLTVKATYDQYFAENKLNTNHWQALKIPKGTIVGRALISVITSQTKLANKSTKFNNVSYGSTWGDCASIGIEMKPMGQLKFYVYRANNSDMKGATREANLTTPYPYSVASEDLEMTYKFPAANTSKGYLSQWSPREVVGTNGKEEIKLFTIGLQADESIPSLGASIEVNLKDDYVDAYDYTEQMNGRFAARYDYKKYNALGLCLSDRRNTIFGNTHALASFEYRAVKKNLGYSAPLFVDATFTLCYDKTRPQGNMSFTAMSSNVRLVY